MLQILPIALAQLRACNTFENLLDEIRKNHILFVKKKLLKKYAAI